MTTFPVTGAGTGDQSFVLLVEITERTGRRVLDHRYKEFAFAVFALDVYRKTKIQRSRVDAVWRTIRFRYSVGHSGVRLRRTDDGPPNEVRKREFLALGLKRLIQSLPSGPKFGDVYVAKGRGCRDRKARLHVFEQPEGRPFYWAPRPRR